MLYQLGESGTFRDAAIEHLPKKRSVEALARDLQALLDLADPLVDGVAAALERGLDSGNPVDQARDRVGR